MKGNKYINIISIDQIMPLAIYYDIDLLSVQEMTYRLLYCRQTWATIALNAFLSDEILLRIASWC